LSEAKKQKTFLENMKNYAQSSGYDYGSLIRNYVDFLYKKLNLHSRHPNFTGNFGYKDVSVREFDYKSVSSFETADLNEGYVMRQRHQVYACLLYLLHELLHRE
jgi:hypothetical protein